MESESKKPVVHERLWKGTNKCRTEITLAREALAQANTIAAEISVPDMDRETFHRRLEGVAATVTKVAKDLTAVASALSEIAGSR